jgi:uncharacterized alpha-E superfamily protein
MEFKVDKPADMLEAIAWVRRYLTERGEDMTRLADLAADRYERRHSGEGRNHFYAKRAAQALITAEENAQ